jgi:hypothetical protein
MDHTNCLQVAIKSIHSMKYNATYAGSAGSVGNGLSNNKPYDGYSDNQTTMGTKQNFGNLRIIKSTVAKRMGIPRNT